MLLKSKQGNSVSRRIDGKFKTFKFKPVSKKKDADTVCEFVGESEEKYANDLLDTYPNDYEDVSPKVPVNKEPEKKEEEPKKGIFNKTGK